MKQGLDEHRLELLRVPYRVYVALAAELIVAMEPAEPAEPPPPLTADPSG
jgi:hypothetical protein